MRFTLHTAIAFKLRTAKKRQRNAKQSLPARVAIPLATVIAAALPEHAALAVSPKQQEKARLEFLQTLPSTNQTIPVIDVGPRCKKEAEQSHFNKANTYTECFDRQQEHYDHLKPIWSKIPADITRQCTGDAPEMQTPAIDYWGISMCVNVLLDELMRHEEPLPKLQFKY